MAGVRAADLHAAGVVAFRSERRVLLVHRPRYDDWSFPKGKLDRGEHPVAAAVREAGEETGLRVRLGRPLADQRYPVGPSRDKVVHYWVARAVGGHGVGDYLVNDEIDAVRWVPAEEASALLSYPRDSDLLAEALVARKRTHAVVVLRHAESRSREAWTRDDVERPLLMRGHDTAERLVPLLAAYGVTRVVTSISTRCVQTVQPYADAAGRETETRQRLSEQDATPTSVGRIVAGVLARGQGSVICTHRPVLPLVFGALGLPDPGLAAGEMVVAHVRKGRVRAVERHLPR